MRIKGVAGVAVFVLGMAINPVAFWGCGEGDQPEYDFGEPEMLALLGSVADSSGWMRDAGGTRYVVEVELAPGASGESASRASSLFARSARACGTRTRTFATTAAACDTLYETKLPVAGTLTVSSSSGGVMSRVGEWQVAGELVARGLQLLPSTEVYLQLDGEAVTLRLARNDGEFVLDRLQTGALRL